MNHHNEYPRDIGQYLLLYPLNNRQVDNNNSSHLTPRGSKDIDILVGGTASAEGESEGEMPGDQD